MQLVRDDDRAAIMGVKVWSEQKPVDTRDKIIRELDVRCGKTVKEVSELKYDWEQAANVAISDSKGIISYVKDKFCEL